MPDLLRPILIEGLRGVREVDGAIDGGGGGSDTGEVVEQGFAIGEGDGGDLMLSSGLEVVGVFQLVVAQEEEERVQCVVAAVLGPESGDGAGGEGVVGSEVEFAARLGYPVQFAMDRELAKNC